MDIFTPSPPAGSVALPEPASSSIQPTINATASSSTLPAQPSATPIKSKYLWPIPPIPGTALPLSSPVVQHLATHVAELTTPPNPNAFGNGYAGSMGGVPPDTRFPGSQPVSFAKRSMNDLEKRNFWVCEKSDGVRVMVLIVWNGMEDCQEVFIIDRKNTYYKLPPNLLPFLHHDPRHQTRPNRLNAIGTTLIDGELVYDAVPSSTGSNNEPVDEGLFKLSASLDGRKEEDIWKGRERKLRLYAFDCLVYDGANLMGSSLQSRYGRLRSWLIAPFHAQLGRVSPEVRANQPFEIVLKKMELADGISSVIDQHIPKLQHAYDGLIFTCAETQYVKGKTDENIMKWKPPEENTVDFELELRFVSSSTEGGASASGVDLSSKPMFVLNAWSGGTEKTFFDVMDVSDETWEEWKASGEQFDNRVIECTWSPEKATFEFMRFRPDKTNGNHISVVHKVIHSIQDGVSLSDLQSRCPTIRAKRKEREARAKAMARPVPVPVPAQVQGYQMPMQGFGGFAPQQGHVMHGTVQGLRR